MPSMNLHYIRACAEKLGATREKIRELEQAKYRDANEWDDHQAAQFWRRSAIDYSDDLGIASDVKIERGDRVLDMLSLYPEQPWTVVAVGNKRVTLEREGARKHADPTFVSRRYLVTFPAEHEAAVVAFVMGYFACNGIQAYASIGDLAQWVTFHARLADLLGSVSA